MPRIKFNEGGKWAIDHLHDQREFTAGETVDLPAEFCKTVVDAGKGEYCSALPADDTIEDQIVKAKESPDKADKKKALKQKLKDKKKARK